DPGECEAAIKLVGSIRKLDLGDRVRIGPTPVNKLVVDGVVVGRDDMDNIILLDTTAIRSIPKKTVAEVATRDLVTLAPDITVKEAAARLSSLGIEGAPIVEDDEVKGIVTLSDITASIAAGTEFMQVSDIMSKNIITVKQDTMIADAIEVMNKHNIGRLIVTDSEGRPTGIITRTDILDSIAGLE
ncbi:MAG TPA: CBS domain-containing protein, partial [Methanothermobacter thermautotrophicus]|nr:CBS domain-containing protein [Methanothermobacter thermautotrophicus]